MLYITILGFLYNWKFAPILTAPYPWQVNLFSDSVSSVLRQHSLLFISE